MFIKVHKASHMICGSGILMLLNTDNITSVINKGPHLEIRDTADRCYEITETLSEFWDMVHPDDPVPKVFKDPNWGERRNNVNT